MRYGLDAMTVEQLLDYLGEFVIESDGLYNLQIDYDGNVQRWVIELPGLCRIEEPSLQVALKWAVENTKMIRDKDLISSGA